jgi:hypothetical protein
VAALLVCGGAIAVAANTFRGPQQDGPLQVPAGSHYAVTFPLADDRMASWEAFVPFNPTHRDIRIQSVELVGTKGIDVVGVVLGYPVLQTDGRCLSTGTLEIDRFPPAGRITTNDVRGTVLPAAERRTCENNPTIVVGIRRASDSSVGLIASVRVLYEYQDTVFELMLPQSLEVHRPGSETK